MLQTMLLTYYPLRPQVVQTTLQTMIGAQDWLNKPDPNMGLTPLMFASFHPDDAATAIAVSHTAHSWRTRRVQLVWR